MDYCQVDTVLDVGANTGQYGKSLREAGYKGNMISFEPLNSAFAALKKNADNDSNWAVNNFALGNEDGKTVINIAGNSYSSSILNMLPLHADSAPESKYVGQQEIEIKKLDTIFSSIAKAGSGIMLKIDTQGYEKNVIDGAASSLSNIRMIQLEMALAPLYANELLFLDMIHYLDNRGFQLFSLETGFSSPETGQLLQADGIFVQKAYSGRS